MEIITSFNTEPVGQVAVNNVVQRLLKALVIWRLNNSWKPEITQERAYAITHIKTRRDS